MKGNIDKFLSKTIITYTFLLIIIFILKLVGLDYFGLDLENELINSFSLLVEKNWILKDIICIMPLLLNQFVVLSIVCNDNSKKIVKYNFILTPILYLFEINKINIFGNFSFLGDIIYLFSICYAYKKDISIIKFLKTIGITMFFQLISMFTRYRYSIEYITNIFVSLILNLDYMIMLIIIYNLNFMKGDVNICYQDHHFSFSQKLIILKRLPKKLQRNWLNFKSYTKVEKLTIIIYLILYTIWNLFTLILILFIGFINDTFIECIFILTSFWLSKRTFGKPFHLQSMLKCFVVSNLTYYALNRVTTPLGISIIVPIILGVGLSYVTSKFVKETTIKLYKGMPEEEFDNSILKVTDKDSLQYKICHMFYVERKSELEIAHNVGYSIDNIKKIKAKINKKIKELN